MADLSIASFNIHAGVDGWGRPYDIVEACRTVDADVLVLQESWGPKGEPSSAELVAQHLGYSLTEQTLGGGRRCLPNVAAANSWKRPLDWRGTGHALLLDEKRPLPNRMTRSDRYRQAEPGRWSLALLSRNPVLSVRFFPYSDLARDVVHRGVLIAALEGFTLAATHMSHLSVGSPVQFRQLARLLNEHVTGPAVLAGDMNLWGPPVRRLLPGWRPGVRGASWPSWRPHSQLDHLLVRGPLEVTGSAVLALTVSDHRPVRITVALP
jgi:endonuclease/exonuclease/phosphatase family metal-dependent hydrolase